MFRTGMGRPVPVSRTSIDKATAVLEGKTITEQGDFDKSTFWIIWYKQTCMPLPFSN
jgi:hypothetical protein